MAGSRAPGADDLKRDMFKKVISYMTIGIDVLPAFGEMVMCSITPAIVLKMMCYLYVGNYARVNPDLALLTINFLQKDCKDEDSMIRGLALRSLCTLRVQNLVEYLMGPLGLGLKDSNSYVRMVAAIGVLKLYHISAATCIDADFPAWLKHLMFNDPDSQVVANCLAALREIWSAKASTSEEAACEREALLSKPHIYYSLNRIKEFNEWAQCLVLELVAEYVPSDNNEIFYIMNLLEDRLQHANGAVVFATIKVFMQLTLSMTDVRQQVYERIKAPLLTFVSSGGPAQSYAVLSHLHLLVTRAPFIFTSDYKHFYCQYNEPFYVKKLELQMLTAVANESNTYEIVTELCEYAANVDESIARESIRAVGKIALQQYDVNAIVDRLLQFLEMEKDYVTEETLVLVKDLLRKYSQWSHDCIPVVGNNSTQNVREPKAKAALRWILGEYSKEVCEAPYVLESLVENWEEERSAEVRLHLLTATLKRPPETQKALGAALAAGLADFHQDVHDRALFYYKLLQYDVSMAGKVVNPPKQAVSVFSDTQSSEVKDRVFDEFNSLSRLGNHSELRWVPQGDARDIHSFLENTADFGGHDKSDFGKHHDITTTKWALLVAGSNGYSNYRHQSDVCHAYQILKKGGVKDENIIVFMYDDIAYNIENPLQGVIRNRINGPNVYPGVVKDYTGQHITVENFYNVILANRSGLTGGSGKVLDSGPNDHIFIYFSGHGQPRAFDMPNGGRVDAYDFVEVLKSKHQAKSYSEMVIYLEACKSGSIFEGILPENLNIYATTAANPYEISYGCYWDGEVDAYLGDCYSVSWMEDSETHDLTKETLDEQYERVRARVADPSEFDPPNSHVMFYGTKSLGTNTLSNFFGPSGKKEISVLDEKITGSEISLSKATSLLRLKYLRAPKGSPEMHEAKKQPELDDEIAHTRKHVDQSKKRLFDV